MERITNKALSKDASRRYQTAADLIADLSSLDVSSPSQTSIRSTLVGQSAVATRSTPSRKLWGGVVIVAILLIATFWIGKSTIESPPPRQMLKIALSTGSVQVISRPAISENARYIAFLGRDSTTSKTGFYLKDLQEGTTRYLEETEYHYWAYFSPDNKRLAVTDGRGSSILTLPDGQLSRFTDYVVTGWYSDQELFTQGSDAAVISLDESPTGLIFVADSTLGHLALSEPVRIGNSDLVWFATRAREGFKADLVLYDTKHDSYSVVQKDATWKFFWMDSGHILIGKGQSGTEAHVRPFDPKTGAFTGPDFNLEFDLDPVMNGYSKSGHLIRAPGTATYRDMTRLFWLDLDSGENKPLDLPPDWYVASVLSPDGNKIVSLKSDESFKELELTSSDLTSGLTSDHGSVSSYFGPFWPEKSEEFFFGTDSDGGFTFRGSNTLSSVRESNSVLNGFELGDLNVLDVSEDMSRVIAYRRLDGSQVEIVVLSVETGDILHSSKSILPQIALSPDGSYYAMIVESPGGQRLIAVQVEGSETHVLAETNDNIASILWSGSGSEILYQTYSRGSEVSFVHRLNIGLQPAFSLKGSEMVGEIPGIAWFQDVDHVRNRLLYSTPLALETRAPAYELELILNMSDYLKQVAPPSN